MEQSSISKWLIGGVFGFAALALGGRANAQQFVTQLHAPEPKTWHDLGRALAIDANTFAISAPESIRNQDCSAPAIGYGAVAIYKKSGGSWSYAQKLWHDTTSSSSEMKFGRGISLRGDVLVVSAEREDFSSTVTGAGAFVVFSRPSANAAFSKLGTFFSPNPLAGARLGEGSGVASNAQFIAVGDVATHAALVYRLQNGSVSFAYAIPMPVPARFDSLFITDSNVLVATILGYPSVVAYGLGQNGYSTLNTTALTRPNTVTTGVMSGSGNTVATVLRDVSGETSYLTQVANFSNAGVSWVDNRPISPALAKPNANVGPRHLSLQENQGFFVSFTGSAAPFLLGYKFSYNGGTGHDYNYAGVFAPGAFASLPTLSTDANAVAFNGTDLLLGDTGIPRSSGDSTCGFDSEGGVDIFNLGPIAAAGPSGSSKLQPWLTSSTLNNGAVVATAPGYALVGSGNASGELGLRGQVLLYRQVGSTWELLEKYLDGFAGVGDNSTDVGFGGALAVNYHALFIAANQGGALGTGAVYEADALNGAYQHGPLTRTLALPTNVDTGDNFGSSLALDVDTLLVGAVQGGPNDTRSGSAYVYAFNAGAQKWDLRQELQPPAADIQPWLAFGGQVAVSGDYAIVGAPLFDGNGLAEPGAVYVYHRVNGSFVFVQRLLAPQPSSFDDFGQTLAIANAGNYLAVSGNNSGVRLFRLNGTSFVSDGGIALAGTQFAPLALSNLGLVVATPSDARVRRYARVGNNNWVLGGTLTGPANQLFGSSVAMQDSSVLVGAWQSPTGSFTTGAGFATTFANVR